MKSATKAAYMDELVMKGEHGEDQRAGDDPSVLEMKSTLKRSAMKALEKKAASSSSWNATKSCHISCFGGTQVVSSLAWQRISMFAI